MICIAAWRPVAIVVAGEALFVAEAAAGLLWRRCALVGFGDAGDADGDADGDAVTAGHGDAVTRGDLLVTAGDLSGDVLGDARARRRAVSRRSSAKYRAKCKGLAASCRNDPQSYPQSRGDAAPKKEEEHALALSVEARAGAGEAAAAGLGNPAGDGLSDIAAWPREYQRKMGWVQSVLRRATSANLLSRGKLAELTSDILLMHPDRSLRNWALPRRANDELDRLDRLLAAARGGEQRSLPLPPVPAATGPPRRAMPDAAPPARGNNMQRCSEGLAELVARGWVTR